MSWGGRRWRPSVKRDHIKELLTQYSLDRFTIASIVGCTEHYVGEAVRQLKLMGELDENLRLPPRKKGVDSRPVIEEQSNEKWSPTDAAVKAMDVLKKQGRDVSVDFKLCGFWLDGKYMNSPQLIKFVKESEQKMNVVLCHNALKNHVPKRGIVYI